MEHSDGTGRADGTLLTPNLLSKKNIFRDSPFYIQFLRVHSLSKFLLYTDYHEWSPRVIIFFNPRPPSPLSLSHRGPSLSFPPFLSRSLAGTRRAGGAATAASPRDGEQQPSRAASLHLPPWRAPSPALGAAPWRHGTPHGGGQIPSPSPALRQAAAARYPARAGRRAPSAPGWGFGGGQGRRPLAARQSGRAARPRGCRDVAWRDGARPAVPRQRSSGDLELGPGGGAKAEQRAAEGAGGVGEPSSHLRGRRPGTGGGSLVQGGRSSPRPPTARGGGARREQGPSAPGSLAAELQRCGRAAAGGARTLPRELLCCSSLPRHCSGAAALLCSACPIPRSLQQRARPGLPTPLPGAMEAGHCPLRRLCPPCPPSRLRRWRRGAAEPARTGPGARG
ncbi:hypothetical protein PVAP13_5KG683607 [Panicum virgatum]|uniref:Uncharacterized protein n=1 Tax=Panicum virgatum TaxID=38727 RepID=A0A8T0SD38_PANVG|nr:hypothetical protein PVAP13_5KG683607 [Panicum virgatum]